MLLDFAYCIICYKTEAVLMNINGDKSHENDNSNYIGHAFKQYISAQHDWGCLICLIRRLLYKKAATILKTILSYFI